MQRKIKKALVELGKIQVELKYIDNLIINDIYFLTLKKERIQRDLTQAIKILEEITQGGETHER